MGKKDGCSGKKDYEKPIFLVEDSMNVSDVIMASNFQTDKDWSLDEWDSFDSYGG